MGCRIEKTGCRIVSMGRRIEKTGRRVVSIRRRVKKTGRRIKTTGRRGFGVGGGTSGVPPPHLRGTPRSGQNTRNVRKAGPWTALGRAATKRPRVIEAKKPCFGAARGERRFFGHPAN